jgi:hypothetical protein
VFGLQLVQRLLLLAAQVLDDVFPVLQALLHAGPLYLQGLNLQVPAPGVTPVFGQPPEAEDDGDQQYSTGDGAGKQQVLRGNGHDAGPPHQLV